MYEEETFLQNPAKEHSLDLISCGSAPVTVVLSEKVDEDNSILLHKCRKEKIKHHFMRYVSIHYHCNRNKPQLRLPLTFKHFYMFSLYPAAWKLFF